MYFILIFCKDLIIIPSRVRFLCEININIITLPRFQVGTSLSGGPGGHHASRCAPRFQVGTTLPGGYHFNVNMWVSDKFLSRDFGPMVPEYLVYFALRDPVLGTIFRMVPSILYFLFQKPPSWYQVLRGYLVLRNLGIGIWYLAQFWHLEPDTGYHFGICTRCRVSLSESQTS